MSLSPDSGATATQIDRIVEQIRVDNPTQHHIVAFSGGVDSSLALALTNLAFPQTTKAVIGLSAALPATQLELARKVASTVGVSLTEQQTNEGENEDVSCLCVYCSPGFTSVIVILPAPHERTYSTSLTLGCPATTARLHSIPLSHLFSITWTPTLLGPLRCTTGPI